jgi:light-regulated signal transduction histidine kinase (bacteriophytochrome)
MGSTLTGEPGLPPLDTLRDASHVRVVVQEVKMSNSQDLPAPAATPDVIVGPEPMALLDGASDEGINPFVLAPELTDCAAEPITLLERIQGFGFLLALSADWIVKRVSANVGTLLGLEPAQMLGVSLDALLHADTLHDIRNRMFGLKSTGGTERWYGVELLPGRSPYDIAIHYVGEGIVFEGEPAGLDSRIDAASLVRSMVARLSKHVSLDGFHRDAARQVRAITGFDRVMIYRFAADGAGEVIAEAAGADSESLMGLHYPASDIPAQARALYLLNPFRIIPDVGSPTAGLVPAIADTPLNLTLAVTRAVSSVHIQYLTNMGVAASASISIIVDGALWGLIACHHQSPRLPTFVIRTAAELFGQMYSMQLESRLRRIDDRDDRLGRDAVTRMVAALDGDETLVTHAGWLQDTMRQLIQCDGIATYTAGRIAASGATPSAAHIEAIVTALDGSPAREVLATDSLAASFPAMPPTTDGSAGLLSIPLSRQGGHYVLLFRQERRREIRWAMAP